VPHCNAWNTLVEQGARPAAAPPTTASHAIRGAGGTADLAVLADIEAARGPRTPTGIDELDRVLGGGIVEGGVVLIGGDPGIGKSTLLLQAVDGCSAGAARAVRHRRRKRRAGGAALAPAGPGPLAGAGAGRDPAGEDPSPRSTRSSRRWR
jgi:hypothetical protein